MIVKSRRNVVQQKNGQTSKSLNKIYHQDSSSYQKAQSLNKSKNKLRNVFTHQHKSKNIYQKAHADKNNTQKKTKSSQQLSKKSEYYRDMFIHKLLRTTDFKHPQKNAIKIFDNNINSYFNNAYSIFTCQRHKPFKYLQGIQLPNFVTTTAAFLNIIIVLFLLVISTLEGFIEEFAFNIANHPTIQVLKILCLFFSVVTFLMRLTCRFIHGQYKIYIVQIASAYIKSFRFYADVVSILFQIALIIWPQQMQVSGLFFFFLILLLYLAINDVVGLEITFVDRQRSVLLIQAFKIAFSNIIFGHVMASILLAMSRIQPQNNWLVKYEIQNESWDYIYVSAFYWGCTLMMTVGFGDILPSNKSQKIITSFLQIFSCALLGYNISAIGALISQIRSYKKNSNRKRVVFRNMIRSAQRTHPYITKRLQVQILNYIQSTSSGSLNLEYEQRDNIISSLPQNLRKQFYKQLCPKIFSHVAFFNKINMKTLRVLVQKFKRKSYFQNQYLLANSQDQILLLDSGEVGLAYKRRGSTINGEVFETYRMKLDHQLILLTPYLFNLNKKFNYYLVAKKNALTWSISYSELIQTLRQDLTDYEYYFSIYHSHKIDNDFYNFIKCERCSNDYYLKYHSVYDCPRLCYLPIRELIGLKDAARSQNQQKRVKIIRNRNKLTSISSLTNLIQLNIIAHNNENFEEVAQKFVDQKNFVYQINRHISKFKTIEEMQIQQYEQKQKLMSEVKKSQMKLLIQKVVRKYDLQYEDDYWFLQTDAAHNYQLYFPKFNPIKVNRINLLKLFQSQKNIVQPKKTKRNLEKI